MFEIFDLLEWFGCLMNQYGRGRYCRGFHIFGVEPSSPRPPVPTPPPIRPCPYNGGPTHLDRPEY